MTDPSQSIIAKAGSKGLIDQFRSASLQEHLCLFMLIFFLLLVEGLDPKKRKKKAILC